MSSPEEKEPEEPLSEHLLHTLDHYALQSRPYVLLGIIAFLLALLFFAYQHSSVVPLVVASEIALAAGTLALAYAAVLQVASSVESRREEERWRAQLKHDRMKDREPNLVVRIRDVQTTRIDKAKKSSSARFPPPTFLFKEAELYVENVGPGIAANLSATLVRLYLNFWPGDSPEIQEWNVKTECIEPKEIVKEEGRGYDQGPLSLASSYLPVGPQNVMALLNCDKAETWNGEQDIELDRVYVVTVEYTDIEGNAKKTVHGGAWWIPKIADWDGKSAFDIDETFKSESRWVLAKTDIIDLVLADYQKWKVVSQRSVVNQQIEALKEKPSASVAK